MNHGLEDPDGDPLDKARFGFIQAHPQEFTYALLTHLVKVWFVRRWGM